jgi:hypothetical protein
MFWYGVEFFFSLAAGALALGIIIHLWGRWTRPTAEQEEWRRQEAIREWERQDMRQRIIEHQKRNQKTP